VPVQRGLELLQLDPVATALDLMVPPPQQVVVALLVETAEVAGAVGALAAGTSTSVAPAAAAAKTSSTDRSKCRGAWLASRSLGPMRNSATAQSTNARPLAWESMTPLGRPVDPEVNST
jgi:uncharacterized membrane protein